MAKIVLSLNGTYLKRQYLIYVVEVAHDNERFYYIGQTGDNHHVTARPVFRRLAAHLEDVGTSTQNQIYRFIAKDILGIAKAAERKTAFDEQTKQMVEKYLTSSTVTMYAYPLQPFVASVKHLEHLEVVQKVTLFEKIVIQAFIGSSKHIMNKIVSKIPHRSHYPYPDILQEIVRDFGLRISST